MSTTEIYILILSLIVVAGLLIRFFLLRMTYRKELQFQRKRVLLALASAGDLIEAAEIAQRLAHEAIEQRTRYEDQIKAILYALITNWPEDFALAQQDKSACEFACDLIRQYRLRWDQHQKLSDFIRRYFPCHSESGEAETAAMNLLACHRSRETLFQIGIDSRQALETFISAVEVMAEVQLPDDVELVTHDNGRMVFYPDEHNGNRSLTGPLDSKAFLYLRQNKSSSMTGRNRYSKVTLIIDENLTAGEIIYKLNRAGSALLYIGPKETTSHD